MTPNYLESLKRLTPCFLFSALLLSCDDPLDDPALLAETRILAVKAEVVGAPERFTPHAGETVRLRVLAWSAQGPAALGGELQLCPDGDVSAGVPRCSGAPLLRSVLPLSTAPTVEWQLPRVGNFLLRGVGCEAGLGQLGPTFEQDNYLDASCLNGSRPLLFSAPLAVTEAGFEQQNPNAEKLQRILDGGLIPTTVDACKDGLQLPSGGKVQLELTLTSGARASDSTLLAQHFTTAGTLNRSWSDFEQALTQVQLELRCPSVAVPTQLSLIHVLRDSNGGVDWAVDHLCITPTT